MMHKLLQKKTNLQTVHSTHLEAIKCHLQRLAVIRRVGRFWQRYHQCPSCCPGNHCIRQHHVQILNRAEETPQKPKNSEKQKRKKRRGLVGKHMG